MLNDHEMLVVSPSRQSRIGGFDMAVHLDPHNTKISLQPRPTTPLPAPDDKWTPQERTERPTLRRSVLRREPLPGLSTPNIALAGLQLLIGYEWLVSGVDKLLFGTFPDSLTQLLTSAIGGGRLPGFFADLLQALVMPNAPFFGVVIEWSETLAGLGLMAAGLAALLRPLAERYLKLRAALIFSYGANLLDVLAPVAAAGAGLLGLSFFLLDGLPTPWFAPTIAYGGAIDTGLFLAIASTVLVASQLVQRRHAH
jgi:hypothetical protein